MDLITEILQSIWNSSLTYKGVRTNLLGIPKFRNQPENSIRSTLSVLKKKGYADNYGGRWCATRMGKKYVQRKLDSLPQFMNTLKKGAPKNLIVMYDIPENKKAEREWFRWHLKKFGYEMIQKSIWVGPSPLPKEFLFYIKKIKLESCIKTFRLARAYNFSK